MKVLILGATGMAGHMIYHYLNALGTYKLYTVCFRNKLTEDSIIANVYDHEALKQILKKINPAYVINCIGILIKGSKLSAENAIYLNAYFPHLLARLMDENDAAARLIHISTDCVFSGTKGLYEDTDKKDALDIYGMTKNLGEIIDGHNLTIRTSIIGPELKQNGEGLFHWIFSQRAAGEIDGYAKIIWGGVTTLELGKAIDSCMENSVTGLYQLTNGEKISKYELLQLIIKRFELKLALNKVDGLNVDKSILPSKDTSFNYTVPSYTDMIENLYTFMTAHQDIYQQYFTPPP